MNLCSQALSFVKLILAGCISRFCDYVTIGIMWFVGSLVMGSVESLCGLRINLGCFHCVSLLNFDLIGMFYVQLLILMTHLVLSVPEFLFVASKTSNITKLIYQQIFVISFFIKHWTLGPRQHNHHQFLNQCANQKDEKLFFCWR